MATSRPWQLPVFGEEGGPLRNPGPLIRVPEGTRMHVSVRNLYDKPLYVHGLGEGTAKASVKLDPGEAREFDFHSVPFIGNNQRFRRPSCRDPRCPGHLRPMSRPVPLGREGNPSPLKECHVRGQASAGHNRFRFLEPSEYCVRTESTRSGL